jgi:hypothetical protein
MFLTSSHVDVLHPGHHEEWCKTRNVHMPDVCVPDVCVPDVRVADVGVAAAGT